MHHAKWLFLLVCCLSLGLIVRAQDTETPKRIVGYYASWAIYGREYFVNEIPAEKLTHINYAFVNVSDDGECLLGDSWADVEYVYEGDPEDAAFKGNFRQFQLLKEKNPDLKTLISIGGWTWSRLFSDVALTEESREKFATSCVKFMKDYGFDGLDIDWEYPAGGGDISNHERPEDPENFVLLMEALRAHLDEAGKADGTHYLLTAAVGSDKRHAEMIDWVRAEKAFDFINLMAYDFSGGWSEVTGFNAPLYDTSDTPPEGGSADTSVGFFLKAGVPADKLVLGVPFYGHGWKEVAKDDDGLHQAQGGISNEGTWEPGWFDYADLVTNYIPTMTRYWDDTAKVPWLYSEETGIMITYDDPESLAAKAAYVNEKGLGGVMFWETSADTDDAQLLTALWDALMGQAE